MTTRKDGPPWSKVLRRRTINLDNNETVEDIMVKDVKELHAALPHGVRNIQTELYYDMEEPYQQACPIRWAKWIRDRVDKADTDLHKYHALANELRSLGHVQPDIAEIYSPPRFTKSASIYGLQPGFAIDLTTQKSDGTYWDLSRTTDQHELQELIESEQPKLLTGGPPCTSFSQLRNISNSKRDPSIVQQEIDIGKRHLRIACKAYRQQYDSGRYFLHEHPAGASSWTEPIVANIASLEGVFNVTSDLCRYGLTTWTDSGGIAPAKKATLG